MEELTPVFCCPDCRQKPAIEATDDGFGVARCACGLTPLVADVLVPDRTELQAHLIDAIRKRDFDAAQRILMDNHASKARWMQRFGARETFERFVRHRLISDIVNGLRLRALLKRIPPTRITSTLVAAAQWNVYIRHRFSTPSMLAAIPLLGLLRDREGMVLDAPCGMGHLSFLISKMINQRRIVCMDLSPAFVYSTRRFFIPDAAAAIVHDMNYPLPLSGHAFGAVFCADAFQYVDEKALLAAEFMRIIRDDGVVVIAHTHNRLQETDYAGNALSPGEYPKLFEGHHVRVFPESYVLDAYLENQPLDLTRQFTDQELNRSPALDVIAAKTPDVFTVHPPVRDVLIEASRNARVNGLYRLSHKGGEVIFRRNLPQSLLEDFGEYRDFLPPTVTTPASNLIRENGQIRFKNQSELLARHVLVDVPQDY